MKLKKSILVFMILFLLFSFSMISYAVELNMMDDTDLNMNSTNTTDSTNTTPMDNTNDDTYSAPNDYDEDDDLLESDDSSDLPVTVSNVSSASDGELQLSDILNILLIVIGILLILLAIAILIRLKG